jgi:hypothetical protein
MKVTVSSGILPDCGNKALRPPMVTNRRETVEMKIVRIGLATALLAASGAAGAQSATDARCLLLSNAFANGAKDENAKKAAEVAGYFYLGRISEHATAAQLKPVLERESKSITDANAGAQMTSCVKAIQDKVQLVQSLGPSSPPAATPPTKPPPNPQGR